MEVYSPLRAAVSSAESWPASQSDSPLSHATNRDSYSHLNLSIQCQVFCCVGCYELLQWDLIVCKPWSCWYFASFQPCGWAICPSFCWLCGSLCQQGNLDAPFMASQFAFRHAGRCSSSSVCCLCYGFPPVHSTYSVKQWDAGLHTYLVTEVTSS